MTISDLIKDFIDTSKERLKTPISGAFLWSFLFFNWRPILLLFFSDTSIENKIIVINHEYCTFWAIFWPIVIATFYTLLIPKIMLQIDNDLADTKDLRVTKRYEAKKHLVQQKTNVAKEEFLLKSAESGNREIQDLLDQIESLKQQNNNLQESIKGINESNNKTILELNNRLKTATDALTQSQRTFSKNEEKEELRLFNNLPQIVLGDTLHLPEHQVKEIISITDNMDFDDYIFVKRINPSNNDTLRFENTKDNSLRLQNLRALKILTYKAGKNFFEVELTDNGFIVNDIIRSI